MRHQQESQLVQADQDDLRVRELPFDSDRKRMTIVTLDARGREGVHTKGSADVLLPSTFAASLLPRSLNRLRYTPEANAPTGRAGVGAIA